MIPRLVLITDWSVGRTRLTETLAACLKVEAPLAVLHRHPGVTDAQYVDEARLIAQLCQHTRQHLFVHTRADVAVALGAHLHLPSTGVDPADVVPFLPPGTWLSTSVHSASETFRAAPCTFALVSPVFGAKSKPGDNRPPLGPGGYRQLKGMLRCPAYALGGIDGRSLRDLQSPDGIAVVSAVAASLSPAEVVQHMLEALPPATDGAATLVSRRESR